MYMEMLLSEEEDEPYSRDRKACVAVLAEHTRAVQEIYANNMELLTIEKELGREEMLQALRHRPEEYQNYFMKLWPVHQSGRSLEEKQRHIHALCCYAMNPRLEKEALRHAYTLATCLRGNAGPLRRLQGAICAYQTDGILPEDRMDERDILRFAAETLKYVSPHLNGAIERYDELLESVSGASAADMVENWMMDKICLFDPAKIRPKRVWDEWDAEGTVFLAMRNVLNLQKEENFYLIGYQGAYVGQEVTGAELRRRMGKCASVCTLFSEFDPEKESMGEVEPGQALRTVLFLTYEECAGWLRGLSGEAVRVGELGAAGDQTDLSILLFQLRGKPERVFVLLTLGAIRNRLFREFGLEDRCLQGSEEGFLSLVSWLKNEVDMLKYFRGLLQLLLGRGWEELLKSGTLRRFAAVIGGNLANQALRMKRPEHYRILAALPQKQTQAVPLFALMRFEGERNTGDTYGDPNFRAPLVFPSKASADAFSAYWASGFSGVGIDRIFWPYFKGMAEKGRVILVVDAAERRGKVVRVEDLERIYGGEEG